MIYLINLIQKKFIINVISLILIYLTITAPLFFVKHDYYNKIYILKNYKYLSQSNMGLIIATVTGESKYLNKRIKTIYKETQINHLLVLSGSNLIIFCHFTLSKRFKYNFSYFFLSYSCVFIYLRFINFLHPVSRAFIFMFFHDIISFLGFSTRFFPIFLILTITYLLTYLLLGYSTSFLLSSLFSLLILSYNYLLSPNFNKNRFLNFMIFAFYMTILSLPIHLIFFNDLNFRALLLSNLMIVPFYDLLTFIMYISYFSGFIPVVSTPITIFTDLLLNFVLQYIDFINYLSKYII